MRNGAQRILLADDLRNFLDLEVSFLKRADVTVLTANDGIEALKIAKQEKPNLILLDIEMPRMSGLECCRILKRDPVLNRTPLIIISANHQRDEALRAGCDECLEKPITEVQLLTFLTQFSKASDIVRGLLHPSGTVLQQGLVLLVFLRMLNYD